MRATMYGRACGCGCGCVRACLDSVPLHGRRCGADGDLGQWQAPPEPQDVQRQGRAAVPARAQGPRAVHLLADWPRCQPHTWLAPCARQPAC